ncbi:sensor histidine kinase [Dactylosporangium fulvum]|uniref:Sensor histidine kinase n=1 Tax=Dactylosporangium fulvum TaxID=53359 RepID=A0ABY5W825_9ACTN|nr:sensor histidine kinase [Dactylosporangium fulvum]UWP86027.1 sensor histidine kinase [Dactylosporangium fulvum]
MTATNASKHGPGHERGSDPFVHEAMLYHNSAEYLDGALRFIYDGIGLDEPMMVAASPDNVALLRERLGPAADAVLFRDMTRAGRNPGRIIPWVLSRFMDDHPGRRVRIIGEPIWPTRTTDEYPACVQHEAMINVAFAGREATILCPYDTARLDKQRIRDSYATHPVMAGTEGRATSSTYDPFGITDAYNVPLPEPPCGATTLRFELADLVRARRAVAEVALDAGLAPDRVGDLVGAVNELATNSIVHGGGSGTLRTWCNQERVVCEVRDFGQITDVMAGRLRPPLRRGNGLVMVHFLADLVQRHTSMTGTTTRVHMLR